MIKKIILLIMKPTILVGGQAVIEGVMMRVPGAYATAVRDPDGKVHVDRHSFKSITERSAFWKKPKGTLKNKDYNQFYQSIAVDYEDPVLHVHTQAEGTLDYTTLFSVS